MNRTYTVLTFFCGLGGKTLGFQQAVSRLFGGEQKFISIGGIDVDEEACEDFRRITKSPALCADIATMTPEQLRAFAGDEAPDVVIGSPPCVGFSGLLSQRKAKTAKYEALNELALTWIKLITSTWSKPPKLILLENVPRIASKGKELLRQARSVLSQRGYVSHASSHNCGELGGLAQNRQRYLLVARHAKSVSSLLYQPRKLRVRGIGEVLEQLPLPGDPSAGPLHVLPKLSWLNWVRLALVPPGGDWRDLPKDTQGAGNRYANNWHVIDWTQPAPTVIGVADIQAGAPSVADIRLTKEAYPHSYGVLDWSRPCFTIAGMANTGTGAYSVGDPRLTCKPRENGRAYGVLGWDDPSFTVTGAAQIDNGPWAVSDPRVPGNPPLAVRWVPGDPLKPPPFVPVLPTADGTWHRPLTTLELAALQGLPTTLDGKPLTLTGKSIERWRKRIGNAVPPPTARAIAEQMLWTLVQSEVVGFSLSASGLVWVAPEEERVIQ